MNLIPFRRITLVSPLPLDEVQHLLISVTKTPKEFEFVGNKEKIKNRYKFNGVVLDNTFSISKNVSYPQNFLPLIYGEMETMPKGTLLSIQFTLFFGSWVLFGIGSFISLFIGIMFTCVGSEPAIALGGYFFFIINYVVATANFNLHVKDAIHLLEESLVY